MMYNFGLRFKNCCSAVAPFEEFSGSAANEVDIPIRRNPSGRVLIQGIITVNTDAAAIYARTTTDGFSSVDSGASDYAWIELEQYGSSVEAVTTSTADSKIQLGLDVGSAAGELWLGKITVDSAPDASVATLVQCQHLRLNSAGTLETGMTGGFRVASQKDNGIRIYPSTGTFDYDLTTYYFIA